MTGLFFPLVQPPSEIAAHALIVIPPATPLAILWAMLLNSRIARKGKPTTSGERK